MALLFENGDEGPHVKARSQANPSYPKRAEVSDAQVSWAVDAPNYKPVSFTSPKVITNDETVNPKGWADPPSIADTVKRRQPTSMSGPVQWGPSTSYEENGKHVELPRNPRGRTGIEGRGLLGRWGANPAGDALVTRTNPATGQLEMLAIQRGDTDEWAMPGGMKDGNETPFETISRELREETGVTLDFHQGTMIYQGYVDDPRNTDNAWMETTAVHLHLTAEQAAQLSPEGRDDAKAATWVPLTNETLNAMYASHADVVRRMMATTAPATS
jgi:ADP-ribose pyrophosphatase